MPRQSAFQQYLDRLPEPRRSEMEAIARTASSATEAVKQLKRRGCRCSYDAVLSWRNTQKRARVEATSERVASPPVETEQDPIRQIINTSVRLNALCANLITQLENHQWVEEGEARLSSRQAEKILAGLPAVARTSISGLIETYKLQVARNEKDLCLAMVNELGEDWRKTLQHDNPELLDIFDSVATVTKSRLELDRTSALDAMLEDSADATS